MLPHYNRVHHHLRQPYVYDHLDQYKSTDCFEHTYTSSNSKDFHSLLHTYHILIDKSSTIRIIPSGAQVLQFCCIIPQFARVTERIVDFFFLSSVFSWHSATTCSVIWAWLATLDSKLPPAVS